MANEILIQLNYLPGGCSILVDNFACNSNIFAISDEQYTYTAEVCPSYCHEDCIGKLFFILFAFSQHSHVLKFI